MLKVMYYLEWYTLQIRSQLICELYTRTTHFKSINWQIEYKCWVRMCVWECAAYVYAYAQVVASLWLHKLRVTLS